MNTSTGDNVEKARLLRDLLDDAHRRIRELQSRVDQLADELLTIKLFDRRQLNESHGHIEHERRRARMHAAKPEPSIADGASLPRCRSS